MTRKHIDDVHNDLSPFKQIVRSYKIEQSKPAGALNELFHFHIKPQDARQQLKLLEILADEITHFKGEKRGMSQLAALLLFKAMLTDPNSKGQTYNHLAKKINIDKEINRQLKEISRGIRVDFTDPKYLKISREAFELGSSMIASKAVSEKFPKQFLKDLSGIISTEIDYIDRVSNTLNGSISKP